MIEIEGKVTKSFTDSGAYLMVMAIEWAKYLGIENKIDKTQVPKETNGLKKQKKQWRECTLKQRVKTLIWQV